MKIDIRKSAEALKGKLRVAFSQANMPRISMAKLKGEAKLAFGMAAASTGKLLQRLRKLSGSLATVSFRTMMIAGALGSAAVSVKATIDIAPYSKSQDIKLLNECNFALQDGKKCSPAAAAEKARSNAAIKDLFMFMAGGAGVLGFGVAAFPMSDNRKKKKPEAKPA